MSEELQALADGAFREFGAALGPQLTAAGVDVSRAWGAAQAAKVELSNLAYTAADGIEKIHANPYILDIQRADMLRQNGDLFKIAEQAATKKVQDSLALVKQELEAAAISDLMPAEAGERGLIRDEIDKFIAGTTKPKSEAWGGAPFRPGDTVKEAMLKLVQANPARYGAEIASEYGKTLLGAVGAGHEHAELVSLVRLATPGLTPKAQNARLALDAMKKSRIEGMPSGLSFNAKQRVEAALKPPAPTGYRLDTIRPIR